MGNVLNTHSSVKGRVRWGLTWGYRSSITSIILEFFWAILLVVWCLGTLANDPPWNMWQPTFYIFKILFLTFIENLGLSVVPVDHIFRHLILYGGLKRMSTTWTVLHVSFVGGSWIQEMNSTSWMIKSFCASSTMKLLSPKVNNGSTKLQTSIF